MSLENQEKRLLELVHAEQERQCRELLQQADQQARTLLQEARVTARKRVRAAAGRERARAVEQLSRLRAAQETRRRHHEQRRHRELLDHGWRLLNERLLATWRARLTRHRWIRRAVQQALLRVPVNRWQIAHPSDWSAEDQRVLTDALDRELERPLEFAADDRISAGLMVRSGQVVLDMTLEGLTADRDLVEAQLLALIEEGERS